MKFKVNDEVVVILRVLTNENKAVLSKLMQKITTYLLKA